MRGGGAIRRAWTLAVATIVLVAACSDDAGPPAPTSADPPPPADAAPPDGPAPPEPPPESPPEPLPVVLALPDAEVAPALDALTGLFPERPLAPLAPDDTAEALIAVSNAPLPDAEVYEIGAWAAVVPQRHDLFALTTSDLTAILRGQITDWAALGGASRPITVVLDASQEAEIARLLHVTTITPPVERVAATAIPGALADRPGALAFLPTDALTPGILALVVDGHDPYRDPTSASPLARRRWLRVAPESTLSARTVATALGWREPAAVADPVSLLATGDVIPARCVNTVLEAQGDFGAMFRSVRDRMIAADLTVIPLEVALTDRSAPTPCFDTFILQGRPAAADAFAAAGVDVVLAAGNHAMDCWEGCFHSLALADTHAALMEAGLPFTGSGPTLTAARTPAIVERGGVRFAFLAYDDIAAYYAAGAESPGVAPLDPETLADDVRAARALADHVVVGFSWGTEYVADPTTRQREAAGIAVAAGASLIVGNHPHWVQAVETIDGALVVYALGNFVFDQDWSIATMQGAVLEASFSVERVLGYRLRPIAIRELHRPEFVPPAGEGAPILRQIWDATDRLPPR